MTNKNNNNYGISSEISEAKNDAINKVRFLKEIQITQSKFLAQKPFPSLENYYGQKKLHAVCVYHHVMRLIFVRAKHLHESLYKAIQEPNAYSAQVLLKAYWETVGMMGYAHISGRKMINKHQYDDLLNWAVRNGLGGKGFPSDELLKTKVLNREEFTQTNVISMMENLDRDFNKRARRNDDVLFFSKTYKEFIGEGGHPTFLGLSICEVRNENGAVTPLLDKKCDEALDLMAILSHTCIANFYFWHYWNEFLKVFTKQIKEVP